MLLVVHHTPSPTMQDMLESVLRGARDDAIDNVDVCVRPALSTTASDVLAADGYLLGTPANIGYMAGALKHFFDTVYYPCLTATIGRPFGLYVHGNDDVAGAIRGVDTITGALGWRQATKHVTVTGQVGTADRDRLVDLGGTLAVMVANRA